MSEGNRHTTAVFLVPDFLDSVIVKRWSMHFSPTAWETADLRTHIPTAWVHVCEDAEHEISQGERPEGGGEDDVAAQRERVSQKDGASVDVGGGHHGLLGQDVMHPILTVQLHL